MLKALFKLVILLVVLVAAAGFFLGWWGTATVPERDAVATAGRVGAERAREAGQEISQKTAAAAKTAQEALSDGALTAKIKAKMALDDSVKALDLNVDTVDGVVTVTGHVRSRAERERALALARETDGVRNVVDRLTITDAR
jgi:hyperosmotically inducible periplasmic protein